MVPMADMLNAAYERDNARLFSDDDDDAGEEDGEVLDKLGPGYTMISTQAIKQGEQIVRYHHALALYAGIGRFADLPSSTRMRHRPTPSCCANTVMSILTPYRSKCLPYCKRKKSAATPLGTPGTKSSSRVTV